MSKLFQAILIFAMTLNFAAGQTNSLSASINASTKKLETELIAKYGESQRQRLREGMQQIAAVWRPEDGSQNDLEEFVRTHFAGDQATVDAIFERLERNMEQFDGHLGEIGREFREQSDLDVGPILPIDEIFAGYDPGAHAQEDFFRNKVAFIVLLNFPVTNLSERLAKGEKWTRRQWAETRLAQRFARRVPAEVNLAISQASSDAAQYIAGYNIHMHNLTDPLGTRLFPVDMRLLSHWNLRDQIKSDYADQKNGLEKQRQIAKVMEHIVSQTIPQAVIDNPNFDWDPYTNEVKISTSAKTGQPPENKFSKKPLNSPEPNTRYAKLLDTFKAMRKADRYSADSPTLIARRFNDDREMPEARVREMFEQILTSPLAAETARRIEKRLGRPLEPFDIWYNGFRQRSTNSEDQLDALVSKKYGTAEAFQKDIPNILVKLGFTRQKADFLAANIVVDPARGSGHALGSAMRQAKVHLRTRVGKNGMDYKGYNIAVHELGHNVEQVFSLHNVDQYSLSGVPNTAFTEALAFGFQKRDLELLGLVGQANKLEALDDFWSVYEIAGVALVDMEVWKWMYANPAATPAMLKDATVRISKEIWNKYYAPNFRKRDVVLLGIYSHMIDSQLYLPDYPIGHLIAFQVREYMGRTKEFGAEFERMASIGRLTPDLWMKAATGDPVSPEALLSATRKALNDER